MGNSVNQETLISPNFLLMKAFKWVVEAFGKVWLGRKVFSSSRRSFWLKRKRNKKPPSQPSHLEAQICS